MLEFVMDVEDSALYLLVQSVQVLWMKNVSGENVLTVVSYLKGTVLLLQNCTDLPIDLIGILHDILTSARNEDVTALIKAMHFNHKMKTKVVNYTTFLNHANSEYRSL